MNFLQVLPMAVTPLLLMSYGWYLGQLHQSGPDLAGILLFFTGAAGLVPASLLLLLTRKYPWQRNGFVRLLFGTAGCGIVFAALLVFSRLHG
jgi:hypothetical protein